MVETSPSDRENREPRKAKDGRPGRIRGNL